MSQRALVTGGLGYLGSILCEHLLDAGFRVRAVDNLLYGQGQQGLFHLCAQPKFDFVKGDVRDESVMRSALKDVDVVVHLAAIVGASACDRDPGMATSVNLDSVKLLNRLRSPQQLVIYPNTNSGYGSTEGTSYCTEETPLLPISLYGKTKCEAEMHLLESKNTITLRLATVFGMAPRMRLDLLVNDFVYRAVNDRAVVLFESHFKRNYIHIRDVVRAFLFVLRRHKDMAGKAFNVGLSDANLSKRELCERIKLQLPKFTFIDAPIGEDPDKRDYIVSNARIEGLGFRPVISLDLGIAELVKGFGYLRNSVHGNIV